MEPTTSNIVSGMPANGPPKQGGVAKRTKSRNGCRECKNKRLKCDETKPSCNQCHRRGRQCPGYVRDFKFSSKHERLHSFDTKAAQKPPKPPCRPTLEEAETSIETMQPVNHCSPLPPYNRAADFSNLALPPLVPSRTDSSSGTPSSASPKSVDVPAASPRSGYLSWAEVLSPSPSTDSSLDGAGVSETRAGDEAETMVPMPVEDGNSSPQYVLSPFSSPQVETCETLIPYQLSPRMSPRMLYTPIDLPSTLIEYWFQCVSPMWSAFDSDLNPNRQLAISTYQNSEPVFHALQSMSAACLVDSLPHLQGFLGQSMNQTLGAIRRGVDKHLDHRPKVKSALPVDLLLAMFAMATSLCWKDTSQLGEPLVVGARALLDHYEKCKHTLDEEGRRYLSHFQQALQYTEMLHNFVSSGSAGQLLASMRERFRTPGSDGEQHLNHGHLGDSSTFKESQAVEVEHEVTIHPWTGVSGKVQQNFGVVMALCREFHLRRKRAGIQHIGMSNDDIFDYELAQELESDLLRMASTFERSILQTGDPRTPLAHLLDTAEAYRLAALLQLYLTFQDLDPRNSLQSSEMREALFEASVGKVARQHVLVALTLQLVTTLERIPADSGTRCIQPVLYISAATGLRFDTPVQAFGAQTCDARRPSPPLTQCTPEIARARQFIVGRLQALQRSLPPRPITVALSLVTAIWSEYDHGDPGVASSSKTFWMDVMLDNDKLRTLFG